MISVLMILVIYEDTEAPHKLVDQDDQIDRFIRLCYVDQYVVIHNVIHHKNDFLPKVKKKKTVRVVLAFEEKALIEKYK